MKLKELGELLDLLRQKGVTEFSGHVDDAGALITVKLAGDAPSSEVPNAASVQTAFKKMMKAPDSQPRGPDGLTAADQEELYGVVLDEFPES